MHRDQHPVCLPCVRVAVQGLCVVSFRHQLWLWLAYKLVDVTRVLRQSCVSCTHMAIVSEQFANVGFASVGVAARGVGSMAQGYGGTSCTCCQSW